MRRLAQLISKAGDPLLKSQQVISELDALVSPLWTGLSILLVFLSSQAFQMRRENVFLCDSDVIQTVNVPRRGVAARRRATTPFLLPAQRLQQLRTVGST